MTDWTRPIKTVTGFAGLWPKTETISTLDLLKREAMRRGLDPSWFDELANLPSEPGSLGPSDPGKLGLEKVSG